MGILAIWILAYDDELKNFGWKRTIALMIYSSSSSIYIPLLKLTWPEDLMQNRMWNSIQIENLYHETNDHFFPPSPPPSPPPPPELPESEPPLPPPLEVDSTRNLLWPDIRDPFPKNPNSVENFLRRLHWNVDGEKLLLQGFPRESGSLTLARLTLWKVGLTWLPNITGLDAMVVNFIVVSIFLDTSQQSPSRVYRNGVCTSWNFEVTIIFLHYHPSIFQTCNFKP